MKCETCNGTGWRVKKDESVNIVAPISGNKISLETLKAYIHKRLCCANCNGTGKNTMTDDQELYDIYIKRALRPR